MRAGDSTQQRGPWQAAGKPKRRSAPPQQPARLAQQAETAVARQAARLPTLGFKVVDGVEPILPLIRSGHKRIELRRRGARLSDGSVMDDLGVGAGHRPRPRPFSRPRSPSLRRRTRFHAPRPHQCARPGHQDNLLSPPHRCVSGDRFVGEPLAASLTYRCILEVTGPIGHHASHGAAWEAHRLSAVPHALGEIRFSIPVRMVAWLD